MKTLLQTLRDMGVTKTPAMLDYPGEPFPSFLVWATGNSDAANSWLAQFLKETGRKEPENTSPAEIKKFSAAYIDWLIVNHWGEEEPEESEVA